jgi:hypothetical protein
MSAAAVGAHPVRDVFAACLEELAHKVRSYNDSRQP